MHIKTIWGIKNRVGFFHTQITRVSTRKQPHGESNHSRVKFDARAHLSIPEHQADLQKFLWSTPGVKQLNESWPFGFSTNKFGYWVNVTSSSFQPPFSYSGVAHIGAVLTTCSRVDFKHSKLTLISCGNKNTYSQTQSSPSIVSNQNGCITIFFSKP